MVLTFFFESLDGSAMGQECARCDAWCERCDYSKTQWRKGDDAICKGCTGDTGGACPTCGESRAQHLGGCCTGEDIGTFSGSHKGADRQAPRPFGTISFPS